MKKFQDITFWPFVILAVTMSVMYFHHHDIITEQQIILEEEHQEFKELDEAHARCMFLGRVR